MTQPPDKPFGIYVHWPYCLSKCPYCDFFSRAEKKIDETTLLTGYRRDLTLIPLKTRATSIFFGGGTPCLMSLTLFKSLMNDIRARCRLTDNAEITMEVNPDAITPDKMQALADMGVNRLSIGVQALNERDLSFLGRRHSVQTALTCIETAQKLGFRVNMDLIYARPEQTVQSWQNELKTALSLGLNHYSLYQLTIEPNTVFGRKKITPANDETAARLFETTWDIMAAAGRPAYEISNFATPGEECRHNLTYWLGHDYAGIGPAAHGRLGLTATVAPASVPLWLQNGIKTERLTSAERFEERLLTAVRLPKHDFPIKELDQNGVRKALAAGWITVTDNTFHPTKTGLLFSDTLAAWLCP